MTNSSGTTQTANYDPEQEIRFAIVLYGGVSLAIYINGVAQELLRMVRGTADLPVGEALSSTETIYRELGQIIRPDRVEPLDPKASAGPIRTRFVVDVISGSSAGGINGIALAKALALKRRDLLPLRDVWLDKAQLDSLLNDQGSDLDRFPSDKATSLLNSERMYGMVLETLRAMNARDECTPAAGAFADNLDLFVTATDLRGLSAPIQLTGQSILERIHKVVFRFEYAPGPAGHNTNQFDEKHDAMLAFAGRSTSSFPVAFEPMRLDRIAHQLRRQKTGMTLDEAKQFYRVFFPAYVAREKDFHSRELADGGYLDNRPFSHAIDVIQYRSSTRPVLRKLLFVDPFPDISDRTDEDDEKEITFIDNAILAGSTLPRYEVIREDIRRITNANRRLERLNALKRRNERDKKELKFEAPSPAPPEFSTLDLREVVALSGLGKSYPTYHHLRVYDTTDVLAKVVTRAAGFEVDSDEYAYLRILLRAWREEHFAPYREQGKQTENTFLDRFDADYRMRRLNHMRSSIDQLLERAGAEDREILKTFRASVEAQLASLRETTGKLASRIDSPLMQTRSAAFLRTLLEDHFVDVMGRIGMEAQYARAREIYRRPEIKTHVDEIMEDIARKLDDVFAVNRKQMDRDLLSKGSPEVRQLAETYRVFHTHDALALSFLEGSEAREHAEIQVYRVSPADTASLRPNYMNDGTPKLAGPAFAAFGGFLQRPWREHDMMWGRLDGAERIITALLPDPAHKQLREHYIKKAHDLILAEEFSLSGGNGQDRVFSWLAHALRARNVTDRSADELVRQGAALLKQFPSLAQVVSDKDFRTFLLSYYTRPPQPLPDRIANWAARSFKIVGRMFDELPDRKPKELERLTSRVFRTAGVLVATLLRFAMPESFRQKLVKHWLALIGVAGFIMIVVGPLVAAEGLALVGYATVVSCLSFWIVLRMFGAWLKGRDPFRTFVFGLLAFTFIVLAVLGAAALLRMIQTGEWLLS
jgi:patatin-related protein